MATTLWKGHITFGLVSIPVKLYRAARPDKVSFRQLDGATGARVRQAFIVDRPSSEPEPDEEPATPVAPLRAAAIRPVPPRAALSNPAPEPAPEPEPDPEPAEPEHPQRQVSRANLVKGYEFAPDRYLTLTREELAAITPKTAREMEILEFVQISEVDPTYYETSYYAAPDKGGERAYALLFEALRQSGLAGVAQVAMQRREHVLLLRPGRTGIVLHTMYYDSEIRREDEYRTNSGSVAPKELELALLLIKNLSAPFEPSKYRDTYREKLDELIQAKIQSREAPQEAPTPKPAAVVNILEALQRSLQAPAPAPAKPPLAERRPPGGAGRRRSGR